MKEREVWIDYLRSFIILTVVGHHAALSYTTFAHFNKDAYILSSHPMVDAQRWIGFDIMVYFNDIFFMSLMFLVSGFFVISSLKRKGTRAFLNDRFRRLFVPFIMGVTIVALLAYYPSYIYSHDNKNVFGYIIDFFTIEFWPPGPAWFLWVLFFYNLIFVWIYPRINVSLEQFGKLLLTQKDKPVTVIIFWFIITWVLYVPMRLIFGPEGWASIGPFDFQISRFLLYCGYFVIGSIVGTIPFDRGLLSEQSALMKNWPVFIMLSVSAFILLLIIDAPLRALVSDGIISNLISNLIISSAFVLSCVFSCAAYLTTARAVFRRENKFWGMVTSNAFSIYLIHYAFIIWGQYLLLNSLMPVALKFIIITLVSIFLSISASYYLRKSKVLSRYL